MKSNFKKQTFLFLMIATFLLSVSCRKKEILKEEQLTFTEHQQANDTTGISAYGDPSMNQIVSSPSTILLTGMDRYRLVPVYKTRPDADQSIEYHGGTTYYDYYYEDVEKEDHFKYFMPGIDLIYGYNLINVGHYDLERDTLSYFFDRPVLIRTLYFPGVKKDSINLRPVSRDYFMVSVYDEDTNKDSLINKKDLRRFYHIDQFNSQKTRLIPSDFSVIRSTYDYKNDIMYIYARHDENQNGIPEKKESIAIFSIRLNDPKIAKRII